MVKHRSIASIGMAADTGWSQAGSTGGNEMTSGLGNRGRAVVTPILSLVNIGKRFRGIQALQNVSLEVEDQEIHALVGENGAGKSTLIKMVAGNLRPDAGRISFKGKEISWHNPAQARAAGISVIYL